MMRTSAVNARGAAILVHYTEIQDKLYREKVSFFKKPQLVDNQPGYYGVLCQRGNAVWSEEFSS